MGRTGGLGMVAASYGFEFARTGLLCCDSLVPTVHFAETLPGMGTGPWWWRRNINIMMESIFVVKLVCA